MHHKAKSAMHEPIKHKRKKRSAYLQQLSSFLGCSFANLQVLVTVPLHHALLFLICTRSFEFQASD